jgi:hypothetical protein
MADFLTLAEVDGRAELASHLKRLPQAGGRTVVRSRLADQVVESEQESA